MAYLVTGGTGYIGSYVVRDLVDKGKDVVCLQRSGVTPVAQQVIGQDRLARVKIVPGDVGNTIQLFDVIRQHNIDLIVHTGYAIPPGSERDPASALRTNCVGMNNLLEAVRLFGLKRVVWTSAGLALGRVSEYYKERLGDDDAIYMPFSMYGATKVLNEYMCKHYHKNFGVDSIGFRLELTFGVGRWHGVFAVLMDFFRKAALNIPVPLGGASQTMGFIYVENASNTIAEACDVPPTKTRVFNLIEGEYTWRQFGEAVLRVNPQARITFEEGDEHALEKGHITPHLDTTGVRTELGWKPKYRFEEGLRRVMNYFRQKEGMPLL